MNIPWHDPAHRMDHLYRHARHIYDATRKYYLLGRDQLLDRIAQKPAHRILEIGCGTARNLIGLAHRLPQAQLFGLDASAQMLKTATRSVHRSGQRIVLRHGLAENLDHFHTFGLTAPFDTIFFSYSLSMMPGWPYALQAALQNLKPNGRLYIVDFYDQADLPKWFAKLLTSWINSFDAIHRPELLDYLHNLAQRQHIQLNISPIKHRYAYIAEMQKHIAQETQSTYLQTLPNA